MNRGDFIKRAALAALSATALRHLAGLPPAPAPTLVWPDGTFLLDQGTLELGIVRDSILTSENNFQIFGEVFERVGNVGHLGQPVFITSSD